ncbi:MAG: carbohydrate binding domain-containing protein [Treponema sp.]|nr:carbohydrate binding domain-containing protein [Treponema sp.]
MKKIIAFQIFIMLAVSAFAAEFKSDFKPFGFYARPKSGSEMDASYLNTPITEKERISVGKDGHLYAAGKRIRIFGTNLSSFPPVEDAAYWAETLAAQGINCIRFHHTDSDWADCFFKHDYTNHTVTFNEKAFERFDKFFYELKKNGIYSNINLLTGRSIRPDSENNFPQEIRQVSDWKDLHCYGFWNELAREDQKRYAEKILNHKNPYTGLTYAQDPAVAFVEINNENSMFKGYFDGVLDRMPSIMTYDLEDKWNEFLLKKGLNYSNLNEKYNISEAESASLLSGKGNLEQHQGAKADLTEEKGNARIKVRANGSEGWHIQYDLYGFKIEANQLYTVTFKAKASEQCKASISVMMNHEPWSNLGFSKRFELDKKWQDFTFAFIPLQADEKPRLTFGDMGKSAGITFEFSDVKLVKGGSIEYVKKLEGVAEGLGAEGRGAPAVRGAAGAAEVSGNQAAAYVKFPSSDDYRILPMEYRMLVTQFLYEIESDYWKSMNDYLKKTLGVKALTFGTALPCAPVSVMAEFDVVDSHAYWNHPIFPVDSWNAKDFYVQNRSLTQAQDGGTLASLATTRVFGKPYSVTEYDHPYPNQFSAEMMPMLAVFASLQDWDCIYSFCYEVSERKAEKARITGYFNQDSNPAKIAGAPVAARIFREFKIKPLEKVISYPLETKNEMEIIASFGQTWNVAPAVRFGARPEDSLNSRIGFSLGEASGRGTGTGGSDAAGKEEGAGGLSWNAKEGSFIFENEEVFASVTMPGVNPLSGSLDKSALSLSFSPQDDFASLLGVKSGDNKWLIFSCSWSGNSGEGLYEYGTKSRGGSKPALTRDNVKLSTLYSGAGKLALALGSKGQLILPAGIAEKKWKLNLLNSDGSIKSSVKKLELGAEDGTLWYELEY